MHTLIAGLILSNVLSMTQLSRLEAALVVNTNLQSMEAIKKLNQTQQQLNQVFDRISSGMRINQAADDAAGLGMAESLKEEMRTSQDAVRNANDGVSLIQTAEGAANEVANILKRMRELAVQSASETLSTDEREYTDTEFEKLSADVDRIATTATFTGTRKKTDAAGQIVAQRAAWQSLLLQIAREVRPAKGKTQMKGTGNKGLIATIDKQQNALASTMKATIAVVSDLQEDARKKLDDAGKRLPTTGGKASASSVMSSSKSAQATDKAVVSKSKKTKTAKTKPSLFDLMKQLEGK